MSLAALDQTFGMFWIGLLRHLWQSTLVLVALFLLAPVLRSAPRRSGPSRAVRRHRKGTARPVTT